MKLFYSPGACSLASHIALEEAGLPFETVRVDVSKGEQRSADYLALNPKGRVPALAVGGVVLTESPAILAYVADLASKGALLPVDPFQRAQAASFVAWCSGTVHGQSFAALFRPARFTDDESVHNTLKAKARADLEGHLDALDARVAGRDWVMEAFSIADLYPLVFRRWAARAGFDLAGRPNLLAHADRVAARPAAARAIAREGIRLDA